MKKSAKFFACIIYIALIFISCKKDGNVAAEQPQPNPTGSLRVKFHAMVVNDTLSFNNNYLNAFGDTFSINILKYYISNVVLTKDDNSKYSIPGSYFLIDHNSFMKDEFILSGIPTGNYKEINFILGVDSAANVSGAQLGDLDPSKGMFWDWNSGYIMTQLEGHSPSSSAIGKKIIFHIGGFTKPNLSLKNISITFNGNIASVNKENTPKLNIKTDISEWFKTPNTISLSSINTVMIPGPTSNSIADNYADAFSFISILN